MPGSAVPCRGACRLVPPGRRRARVSVRECGWVRARECGWVRAREGVWVRVCECVWVRARWGTVVLYTGGTRAGVRDEASALTTVSLCPPLLRDPGRASPDRCPH